MKTVTEQATTLWTSICTEAMTGAVDLHPEDLLDAHYREVGGAPAPSKPEWARSNPDVFRRQAMKDWKAICELLYSVPGLSPAKACITIIKLGIANSER